MQSERTGPRWACQDKTSLNPSSKSSKRAFIFQHLILPSLCPLHTTPLASSPTIHITEESPFTDSLNGAVPSSPLLLLLLTLSLSSYNSFKSQILNPFSPPAHSCFSVQTIVLKKQPICVSLKGCGLTSRLGGRAGWSAARTGGLNIVMSPPLPMYSGSVDEEADRFFSLVVVADDDSFRSRNSIM